MKTDVEALIVLVVFFVLHSLGFILNSRAGDGNRTHVFCLEGRGFTIKLHPRTVFEQMPTEKPCKVGWKSPGTAVPGLSPFASG